MLLFRRLLPFVMLLNVVALSQPQPRSNPILKTEQIAPGQLILSLTDLPYSYSTEIVDGKEAQVMIAPGFQTARIPGRPILPETGVLLKVESGSEVRLHVLTSQFEDVSDISIAMAPWPETEPVTGPEMLTGKPGAISGTEEAWPFPVVEVGERGKLRGQEIVRLSIKPFQYNTAEKRLRVCTTFRVKVDFVPSTSRGASDSTDPFRSATNSLYLNEAGGQPGAAESDRTGLAVPEHWYHSEYEYFKLSIDEDGLYELLREDFLNAGITIDGRDLSTLKLINNGEQIPLWITGSSGTTFDANTRIRFQADRFRNDSTYYDLYTDENIYWLTFDGEPGLRYQPGDSSTVVIAPDAFYLDKIHIEKDSTFLRLDGESTLALGEGWIWRVLFENETTNLPFDLWGLYGLAETCSLRVRVQGTTGTAINPDHHIQLLINGESVGEVFFDDQEERIAEVPFSTSLLHEGRNFVGVQLASDTGAEINQIIVDWAEITYPRTFAARNNALKFRPMNQLGTRSNYALSNFEESDIIVLNPVKRKVWQETGVGRSVYSVESAGFEDANLVRFVIDFESHIERKRGHNLAIIDSGQRTVTYRNFDTAASRDEADAMAALIDSIPAGTAVLVGISDEGSAGMTEAAYLAMESLGSTLTRQVSYRDGWALIGWKGAAAGETSEALARRATGSAIVADTLTGGKALRFSTSIQDSVVDGSFYFATNSFRKPRRLVRDRASSLRSDTQGADYIVITHENFEYSALRLAQYRQSSNGFRTAVVDIQDVYDEFNFGIVHPDAIRDFLGYAFRNWQSPAPSYVVFVGDASWDPKGILPVTTKKNFIPSFGDPISDSRLVCFDGPDDFLPDMFVGRIPAETAEQADIAVDKIIYYEQQPNAAWNKELAFFNGGMDSFEQNIFQAQALSLSEQLETPPLGARSTHFNKTSNEPVTVAFLNKATRKIRAGVLWANFLGHAASSVWDIDIGQPEDWQNSEVFPFITGMSCHSARFANPVVNSLAETYFLNSLGAAAYWGSTGFGLITQDYFLLQGLFGAVAQDTVRSLGVATILSKIHVWQTLGGDKSSRVVIDEYALIGDPAMQLNIAKVPELAFAPQDITFKDDFLLIPDSSAVISIVARNYGLIPVDSVDVRVTVSRISGSPVFAQTLRRKPFAYLDSISVTWDLPKEAGEYRVRAEIDPENLIAENDNSNNFVETGIHLFASELTVVKPFEFSVINGAKPELVVNNSKLAVDGLQYFFELDTEPDFSGTGKSSSPAIPEGRLTTSWSPNISTEQVYYWRARTFNGTDYGPWERSSFFYTTTGGNAWQQQTAVQFEKNVSLSANLTADGAELATLQFPVKAESHGFSVGLRSFFSILDDIYNETSRGHNVVVFDNRLNTFSPIRTFDTFADEANSDALASFINSLPDGTVTLVAIHDEGSLHMNEAGHLALELLGSQRTREVGNRDSWALVGRKGAAIGTVPEALSAVNQGAAVALDTLQRFQKEGSMVSVEVGPANVWRSASFNYTSSYEDEAIAFDILSRNRESGLLDTLYKGITRLNSIDLNTIDAQRYRRLQLRAQLSSVDGLTSSLLKSWAVDFEPTPDLVVDRNSLVVGKDTLQAGEEVSATVELGNLGLNASNRFEVRLTATAPGQRAEIVGHTWVDNLTVDQVQTVDVALKTEALSGLVQLKAEIDPDDEVAELNETNNSASRNVWVLADTVSPTIKIRFDGVEILPDDFVAARPSVVIELRDISTFTTEDTSNINILLDQKKVSFGPMTGQAQFVAQAGNDDLLQALVIFSPELSAGEHELMAIVRDAANNLGYSEVRFFVTDDFVLGNVMNYPNPFRQSTDFTYTLTQRADQVRIKIYTIAGRLIRTMEDMPGSPGFNRHHWDGRDGTGDRLANGVYLYKIVASKAGEQVSVIEKLVVMR